MIRLYWVSLELVLAVLGQAKVRYFRQNIGWFERSEVIMWLIDWAPVLNFSRHRVLGLCSGKILDHGWILKSHHYIVELNVCDRRVSFNRQINIASSLPVWTMWHSEWRYSKPMRRSLKYPFKRPNVNRPFLHRRSNNQRGSLIASYTRHMWLPCGPLILKLSTIVLTYESPLCDGFACAMRREMLSSWSAAPSSAKSQLLTFTAT